MKNILTATAILVSLASPASAWGVLSKHPVPAKVQAMMDREAVENDHCRGNEIKYPTACAKRDALDTKLEAAGWIWEFDGYPGCAADWHRVDETEPFRPDCKAP